VKNSILRHLVFIFLLAAGFTTQCHAQANFLRITNYKIFYGWASKAPLDLMILRQFENEGKTYFLLVDPQTLVTKIDQTDVYQVKPMTLAEARTFFKNTPYVRAIDQAEKQSANIQDAGIQEGMPKEAGITLTADLCPSHRPLDRRVFTDIFTEFEKVERPAPIALSITGIWMEQHPQDLEWLKQLQADKEIYITWINHSFNHRVSATAPLRYNFLLEPGTDINYEVLETEKAMLKNGLLPSVFFRFPGLVSDQQLVYKITDFGVIPVGSDAWLAKGQKSMPGSIVLIHANGNEPIGVDDFITLLHQEAGSIAKKQWLLYDLRESVDQEFETQQ
jgi:hypothetical protein